MPRFALTQTLTLTLTPQARLLFEPLLRRGEATLWIELASLEVRVRVIFRGNAALWIELASLEAPHPEPEPSPSPEPEPEP